MANPSITIPDGMQAKIDGRRPSTTSRSAYIRQAVLVRFALEDAGEWEQMSDSLEPSDDNNTTEATAEN